MTDPGLPDSTTSAAALLDEAEGIAVEPVTQWKLFWTRFRRHRLAMIAGVVLVIIVGSALFADFLPIRDHIDEFTGETGRVLSNVEPSSAHPFGTDTLGRDMLARVIHGGRTSLTVAFITGFLVASLGTVVGSVAGYYGGWVDQLLMRFTDLILSLPLLPVAIVAARILPEFSVFQGPKLGGMVQGEALGACLAPRITGVGDARSYRACRVPFLARKRISWKRRAQPVLVIGGSSSGTSSPTRSAPSSSSRR